MDDQKQISDFSKSNIRQNIEFWVGIILKLTPALATAAMSLVAYNFEARSSAATLLNQREQAETQLRITLFENLIGPLGVSTDGEPLDAYHQSLLVELLMLNFHEHIEFKPLLIHSDKRLAGIANKTEDSQKDNEGNIKDNTEEKTKAKIARNSLRSVARRARDRQVAVLMREQDFEYEVVNECLVNSLHCSFSESGEKIGDMNEDVYLYEDDKDKIWRIFSPDDRYSVDIRVRESEMDWEYQQFEVHVSIANKDTASTNKDRASDSQFRSFSFDITPYDLPFTDNMIIDRKQRFAIGVSFVELDIEANDEENDEENGIIANENVVTLQAIWFPKGYILPHERPVNYQEIRNLLKIED